MGTLPLTTAQKERAIDNGDPRGPWLPCALTISQWAQPLATLGITAQELCTMAAPVSTQAAATAHPDSTDSSLFSPELYLSEQRLVLPQGQRWLFSAAQAQSFAAQQRLFWPQLEDLSALLPVLGQRAQLDKSTLELLEQAAAQHLPVLKCYLREDGSQGMVPHTLWTNKDIGSNHDGVKDLKRVMTANVFDGAKPVALVQRLMHLAQVQAQQGDIILDFFSGSATTAEAVMRANCEDGGKRRFIMVQLKEQCSPDKPAAKAGFADLCALGRTRILKAAQLLQEEFQATVYDSNIPVQSEDDDAALARAAGRMVVDFGFRDFVLASSECTAPAAETTDFAAAYGVAQEKTAMAAVHALRAAGSTAPVATMRPSLAATKNMEGKSAVVAAAQALAATMVLAETGAEASALHLTDVAKSPQRDRQLDLLFMTALEVGLPLSLPYSCLQVAGEFIHVLQDSHKGRALVMCVACNLGSEVLAQLIALQPQRLLLCSSAILCPDTTEQVPVSSAEAQYWPLNHCGQQLLQNLSQTQVLLVRHEGRD
ncbi:MAG: site-specific DNA-methyltransferase [Candidatus Anaerobiospirillum pullicola]|uniref:Site-specific DNA-methyltransferase n=1 Tax=Candidatus Anaerobiospirillum pullicola TaxID=2838451 RepID=A0A948WXJ0_9GAMM|nr:site-specific DNA-methyltransferase [Candidatus Anaerobiospirillum pullicola]